LTENYVIYDTSIPMENNDNDSFSIVCIYIVSILSSNCQEHEVPLPLMQLPLMQLPLMQLEAEESKGRS